MIVVKEELAQLGGNSKNFLSKFCKIFCNFKVLLQSGYKWKIRSLFFFTEVNINFYWYLLQKVL